MTELDFIAHQSMRILLTAPSGLGKTSACLKLLELASGLRVAGVLSLPVFQDGSRVAIHLRDLGSDEERPLARLALPDEPVDVGVWRFDPETVAWGQALLTHLPPVDLVLLDEIGPLELIQHRGLTHLLTALSAAPGRLTVITVRPSLVENLRERLDGIPLDVLPLTDENRDDIPYQLHKLILTKET